MDSSVSEHVSWFHDGFGCMRGVIVVQGRRHRIGRRHAASYDRWTDRHMTVM